MARKTRPKSDSAHRGEDLHAAEQPCLMVEKIGTVGITEHGEHFGMELMFVSGERAAVMFPHDMFQRLLAVLMGAGAAAYSAQIARLGSEERVLVNSGSEAFRPTDFEFGRGRDLAGANILLMRFKKDRLPVFDIALPFDVAGTFAQELLAELAKDGSKPKTLQ